jgi:flagellar protein FlaG
MVNIMNSEITNVVKLSPVTVVKADKQTDERSSTNVKAEQISRPAESSSNKSIDEVKSTQQNDKKSKLTLELVKKAADEGNSLLQTVQRNLQFKVDDSTKELVVKIVDSNSGELVRQIPSEEMLVFIKRMKEMEGQQGFVIQDRA